MTAETTAVTVLERAAIALGSSKAEAELTALAAQSQSITVITNPAGRAECHAAAMAAKNARISVKKAGESARDDANAYANAVIAEQSRLIGLIEPEEKRLIMLRDGYDEKIAAEKAARAEAERIALAQIRTRIDNIKAWPLLAASASPAAVLDDIARLEAMDIDDGFGASYGEAVEAKAVSLAKLREIHAAKVAAEIEAARIRDELAAQAEQNRIERIEIERQRAEQQQADAAAKAQRDAEEQRLSNARAEIAAAQRALDDAKAAEAARVAADAAAAQKVIDDAAAEAKRAANLAAAKTLRDLAAKRTDEVLTDSYAPPKTWPVPASVDSEADALRREIADIAEQMTVAELNLVLHFCNRSILGRQVAA